MIQKIQPNTTKLVIGKSGRPVTNNADKVTKYTNKEIAANELRVIAHNSVEQTEPGSPSDAIQTRPRYFVPKIVTPKKDINVKTGDNPITDVEQIGPPHSDMNLYKNGTLPISGDRIIAPTTTFYINKCKRVENLHIVLYLVDK